MDFEDLHIFAVVARLQSFSQAARQLKIAQSALGRRVQRLEAQFGIQLLDRHSRGARPTPAGIVLLAKIEHLEVQIQQVQRDMHSLKDKMLGQIRLALSHGIVQFLGSKIVERYRARCPDMSLSLIEGKSSLHYDAVINGAIDAGVLYDPEPHPELTVIPLFFERRLLIGSIKPDKDTAAVSGLNTYPVAKLSELPLVLPKRPHLIRLAVEEAARVCGIALTIVLEVDGLSGLKAMVENGLGYTILTYGPAYQEITSGVFSAIPIVEPSLECMVAIVHRTDRQNTPAIMELTTVIGEIAKALGDTKFWRQATPADNLAG